MSSVFLFIPFLVLVILFIYVSIHLIDELHDSEPNCVTAVVGTVTLLLIALSILLTLAAAQRLDTLETVISKQGILF